MSAKYTKELKENAIDLIINKGWTLTKAARKLKITSPSTLAAWVVKYKKGLTKQETENDIVIHPGKGVSVISHKKEKSYTSDDVTELKSEIRKLKDQNTFLKRTLMGFLE
jgi:transposase-like protein